MANEYAVLSSFSKRQVFFRRVKLFGLTFLATCGGTFLWSLSLPTDMAVLSKVVFTALFFLTFGWIAFYFFSSLFGFFYLMKARKMPGLKEAEKNAPLTSRTAILMPVYNEGTEEVFAGLLAMARALHAELEREQRRNLEVSSETVEGRKNGKKAVEDVTKVPSPYDFFVLSDTTDPKTWIKEEAAWCETKKLFPEGINLYYRHRPKNTARKSGNIEDFCIRWGGQYDFMLVLDADSLMEAPTVLKMSRLMQVNETTGIIQAPPMMINKKSLFARIQQFSGHVYGPVVTAGLAYWQVWDSNYWGHNAIIRVKAFMECCGLPVFKGKAPFGGHILSHDFVEASLIRREGWLSWMLPELKGSYEECPSSMIDFAARDRRWCQGNLQHLRILFSHKINAISRVHFTIGIMSYLSSPLWFLFLAMGLGVALWRVFYPPVYFAPVKTLFPVWPIFDSVRVILLFSFSAMMLFLPKVLGVLAVLIKEKKKKNYGGAFHLIVSMIVEIFLSALTAPIMMLFQSKFVLDILLGKDTGWKAQNRSEDGTSWKEALSRHFFHMLIGVGILVLVGRYVPYLFYWMLPIALGPILSVPISVLTSRTSVGQWALKHRLFVIPPEVSSLKIAEQKKEDEKNILQRMPKEEGLALLVKSSLHLSLHIYLLSVNGPVPNFDTGLIRTARAKLSGSLLSGQLPAFEKEEEKYLLYDVPLLKQAALLNS